MEVIKTVIDGVLIIEPKVFGDKRGYFFESFSQREFDEKVAPILGHTINFVQDNESMSSYGVMRGLHFQRPPYTQSTYGQHVSVIIAGADMIGTPSPFGEGWEEAVHRQFLIPKGFAHGFAVLSETAVFQYKCDEFYHPEADGGISILDDSLGIDWKIPTDKALLSEKDTKHPLLKDFEPPFDIKIDLYK